MVRGYLMLWITNNDRKTNGFLSLIKVNDIIILQFLLIRFSVLELNPMLVDIYIV